MSYSGLSIWKRRGGAKRSPAASPRAAILHPKDEESVLSMPPGTVLVTQQGEAEQFAATQSPLQFSLPQEALSIFRGMWWGISHAF